jgi:hypothetical protein
MQKRAAFTSIKVLSGIQVFLLISMSFSIAFLLGQEIPTVSAAVIPVQQGQTIYQNNVAYTVTEVSSGFATLRRGTSSSLVSVPLSAINSDLGYSLSTGSTPPSPSPLSIPNIASVTSVLRANGPDATIAETIRPNAGSITLFPNDPLQRATITPATREIVTAQGETRWIFKDANGNVLKELSPQQVAQISPQEAQAIDAMLIKPTVTAAPPVYKGCLFGMLCAEGGAGYLYTGITHAILAAGIAQAIGSLAGLSNSNTKALTLSFTAGTVAYDTLTAAKGLGWIDKGGFLGRNAGLIGIGVAAAVFVLTYKKESQKLVTFQCLPWEPKLGGEKCEECNKDPLRPCSEYRCKALGQACQLLNPNTNQAQCAWVSKGDVSSPTIQEWAAALKPSTLQYTPNRALRPDARGVKIISTQTDDNCLPAFTNLQFGILTNEPAQCKVDYNRSINFDSMQYYFGESSYYQYNHTQRMRLPAPDSEDSDLAPLLQNDGTFSLFVRCRDANGNVNADEYSINFCVSEGPDTTPPIIEGTSIEDGSPVRFGADSVPIEVYTNEPATCKWSINDREYAEMENTLRCAESSAQVNADLQYTCAGNLTGIQNNANKEFYFRCIDQPGAVTAERNEMRESYKLTLRGTQELTLLSAGPNATVIQASTTAVPIELFAETDDGADEGKATCYFSPTGSAGSYLEFFDTGDIQHKQTLNLGSGNYTYALRCVDAGGNAVNTNVSFGVGVDKNAPMVTRIYRRSTDALQITTNEDAQCFYSKTNCNFNIAEGLPFSYADAETQRTHLAEWKARSVYYIKCRDKYGNEPSPNSCSITVSGVDLSARAVL